MARLIIANRIEKANALRAFDLGGYGFNIRPANPARTLFTGTEAFVWNAMKYAVFGDVHANLEALEAVLGDAVDFGVSRFVGTGDVVGYNADPSACLQRLRQIDCAMVQGNHDYYAASHTSVDQFTPLAKKSILWTRKRLSSKERRYLRQVPLVLDVESFTLVHSSLHHPELWNYVLDEAAAKDHFRNQFHPVCFIGHSHVPRAFIKNKHFETGLFDTLDIKPQYRYLINVGSVGQPRDRNPDAAYVVYDLDRQTIELRRVPYDRTTTKLKVRAAGLPFRNALRLDIGR